MRVLLTAAALAAIAAPALAQEAAPATSFYGTAGYLRLDDAKIDAVNLRLGARFQRYLGIEAEFAKGVEPHTQRFSSVPPLNIKTQLRGAGAVYAVGYLPVMPNADLFARVGYGEAWFKRTFDNPPNLAVVKGSPSFVSYGVGGQYFLDGKNGVRLDYTRQAYKGPGAEDTYAVSYVRKF